MGAQSYPRPPMPPPGALGRLSGAVFIRNDIAVIVNAVETGGMGLPPGMPVPPGMPLPR